MTEMIDRDTDLLKDLEELLAKHKQPEKPESPVRTVWVPVCEHYKTAAFAGLHDERGGAIISRKAQPTKVLWWVKLEINPDSCPVIHQVEARKP